MQNRTKCTIDNYALLTNNAKNEIIKEGEKMKNKLHIVLKELRTEKEITQSEIAKEINISQRVYSNYETGTREPSIDTLITLAEYHKVSLDYITGRYKGEEK